MKTFAHNGWRVQGEVNRPSWCEFLKAKKTLHSSMMGNFDIILLLPLTPSSPIYFSVTVCICVCVAAKLRQLSALQRSTYITMLMYARVPRKTINQSKCANTVRSLFTSCMRSIEIQLLYFVNCIVRVILL